MINVSNVSEIPFSNQPSDSRFSQALYIHGIPAYKVQDVILKLSRAGRILTLDVSGICLPHSLAATDRALIANRERLRPCRTLFLHYFLDLGDNLPGLVNLHRVTYSHIQAIDEVLIMQCCPFHLGTAKAYRVEDRRGSDAASAPHRKLNASHYSFLFLRGVLVSNCPARDLGGGPQLIAISEIVELHHRTIYVIRQAAPAFSYSLNGPPDFFCSVANRITVYNLDALFLHKGISLSMGGKLHALSLLQVEDKHRQLALLGNAAVQLAKRPCRTVPGIGKRLQA